MNSQSNSTTAPVASPRPLSASLLDAVNVLHEITQTVRSWFVTRGRVSDDLEALARMSDRELVDIGLDRASVDFVARGGRTRDYPF